jgi:hypothetical protein
MSRKLWVATYFVVTTNRGSPPATKVWGRDERADICVYREEGDRTAFLVGAVGEAARAVDSHGDGP